MGRNIATLKTSLETPKVSLSDHSKSFIWDSIFKEDWKPLITRVEMQDKLQVQFSHMITKVKTRKYVISVNSC